MPSTSASNSDKGAVLLIILLLWLLLGPDDPADAISIGDLASRRLATEFAALKVLNSSRWGDFTPTIDQGTHQQEKEKVENEEKDGQERNKEGGEVEAPGFLNLTGFRKEDNYAWEMLDEFRQGCLRNSRHAMPSVGGKGLWEGGQEEAVWQNISGYVAGTWVKRDMPLLRTRISYDLDKIAPGITWSGKDGGEWERNVTGREGRIKVRLHDKDSTKLLQGADVNQEVNQAWVTVTMEDVEGSGTMWDTRMHGVHWRKQGALLLTTTSEKFDGIFALPHLVPEEAFFESSQALLNRTIGKRLKEKSNYLFYDARNPWTAEDEDANVYSPSPHCEYVMYLQIYPPDRQRLNMASFDPEKETMAGVVRDIEGELQWPLGAPIRGVPELQMSALLYSPDCSFFLETKGPPKYTPVDGRHLTGMKAEVLRSSLNLCILSYAIIFLGQVYLLKRQMRETSTPSTMGRVSFYTGSIMLLADGLIVSSVMIFMLSSDSSLQSLALMFSAFMSMLVGGAFLYKIFEVQLPDRTRRQRQQNSSADTPGRTTTPASANDVGLPRPVTARPPRIDSLPVIIPSDQDLSAELESTSNAVSAGPANRPDTTPSLPETELTFSTVIGRFILTGSSILFVLIFSTTWPKAYRSLLINVVVFVYLSLWVPQIYRNVLRNCRRALSWRFVIGQSILRLIPIAYLYCRDDNVLFVQTDRRAFLVLAAWVWIQLWVLASQDVLGPRIGVPRSWTPDAWDYHPILREDNLEAGRLPIGLAADEPGSPSQRLPGRAAAEDKDKRSNVRVIDCAICREDLEVQVVRAGEEDPTAGGVAGVFSRRSYMVTPCRHIFHSKCLEGWLRFRLQCPICREDLPPL